MKKNWSEWENADATTGWIGIKNVQRDFEKVKYGSHMREWKGIFLFGFTGILALFDFSE